MSRTAALVFMALFSALGGLYGWARLRSEWGEAGPPGLIVVIEPKTHLVTPPMAEASATMVGRQARAFDAETTDGPRHAPAPSGPTVLTFIMDGCPCSAEAQPFFNRLHEAYPSATFLGVIDAEAPQANRWAERHKVAYPLVLDKPLKIVKDYQISNSAYVVLVDSKGTIAGHWPGYSEAMLIDLGSKLAAMTGAAETPLDLVDAPTQPYSGCPFEF
ncbi:redoxin domain-containing protein [Isosphaeraceae bacterium EP7]